MNTEIKGKGTKMKKMLIIKGTPHDHGNTVKLLDAFIDGLSNDIEIDVFNCFDANPVACNDCGYCKTVKGCKIRDLDIFFDDFFESDIVVFAAPVYNMGFPAPLKALLDRFQHVYNARFSSTLERYTTNPKKAYLLLTSGSERDSGENIIERQLSRVFSLVNTRLEKTIIMKNTDTAIDKNVIDEARAVAQKV